MAALKKKDDDMRAMEERYKMYLEKARDVSKKTLLFVVFVAVFHLILENSQTSCELSPTPFLVGNPSSRSQIESSHS